ncbi:MAG: hypothetical protein KJS97_12305 [Alphaproteobacteria bacterium]|nr:hypothetical protein [Alphaproteobacteria bacterium]
MRWMTSKAAAALALAAALGVSGCETGAYGGSGYGYGGGGGGFGSNLSKCQRNALIGAGVGAIIGGVTAPSGNKTENAVIGGAIGAAGTYGACKLLDNREQARVEGAYLNALNRNAPVSETWVGGNGQSRVLQVTRPERDYANPDCRTLQSSLSIGQGPAQPLPPERYCRAGGGWQPA